ncbi:sensor histidine kinase KdpD [Leptospira noguchii]|uniref:histidine kinase n=1 Tax=Leptospira noguchii TaxID=28182 RepID=A0A9Q8RLK8_9LEPT|nr:sensor histidine kinase KdpD [Leptospira noguchii]TQE83633.1 sensor histidine kinase KdpD [Leptospira noguchii]UOG31355.1 sensor histidine kinase KdpD [Leptospira noguchii]UOG33472.1 sensor histidine kinase KdpD [Leptospira noguchii]UOG40734.1 sensor histidine kinase KdpD [Leptospira noguchii]UOG44308.1 sensor histidine kinase KdpD [Leptospira noguchii]
MIENTRLDPDELLRKIQKEEQKEISGKLKVFFGMVAGVGKTYAMLNAARGLKKEGVDVVVGYIETHARKETEELLEGLEILPRKKIEHRGIEFEEMDIDSILKRKPEVVLVDEFAHTNIQGSRHVKRYQDVIEILNHSINVFTTLNVQHLESQVEAVEKNTSVKIRETIPDSVLDMADEIVLIDLSPDDLRKRLQEGKVYIPEKANLAGDHFFKKENLIFLRETALNYTARHVNVALDSTKFREKILVAIGSSLNSYSLLRYAKRLAYERNGELFAIYNQTRENLTKENLSQLEKNLSFARELGCEILYAADEDTVEAILRISDQKRITRVVIEKPSANRWNSTASKLARIPFNFELCLVPYSFVSGEESVLNRFLRTSSGGKQYLTSFTLILLATCISLFLEPIAGYWSISLLYLFFVSGIGSFFSKGPTMLAGLLSGIFWDFLFIPPKYTFFIEKLEDALMFGAFLFISIIIGNVTSRLRQKEKVLVNRELRLTTLYELSKELGHARDVRRISEIGAEYLGKVFQTEIVILLENQGNIDFNSSRTGNFFPESKETAVANWVYKNKVPAGKFTDTLSLSLGTYFPMVAPGKVIGVIGIVLSERLNLDQENLLLTMGNQIALALERELLSEETRTKYLAKQSERLYTIIFNSLSHELKTPLSLIRGAVTALLEPEIENSREARIELLNEINESSMILNLLLGNLLDMSRYESGFLKLRMDWHDPSDLIHVVVRRLRQTVKNSRCVIHLPENPIPTWMDFTLMEQALFNVVFNAVQISPEGVAVSIELICKKDKIQYIVEDEGPGIPKEDLEKIFEKFYRSKNQNHVGSGLGLSISKSIVETHGGTLTAENRTTVGARFCIEIPIKSS